MVINNGFQNDKSKNLWIYLAQGQNPNFFCLISILETPLIVESAT